MQNTCFVFSGAALEINQIRLMEEEKVPNASKKNFFWKVNRSKLLARGMLMIFGQLIEFWILAPHFLTINAHLQRAC